MPSFGTQRGLSIFMGSLATRLICVVLGMLFLLPAAVTLYTYCEMRYHAIAVDGVIVDASRGRDMGGRPWVQYTDRQGQTHQKRSRAKTHWLFAPRVGERTTVFYDSREPDSAIVDSPFHYLVLPLVFIAAGVSFLWYACRP